MAKVKICGVTNYEDASNSIKLGADYIGFLVEIEFSKDKISREEAKEIIKKIPNAKTIFVTYLQKAEPIIEITNYIHPKYIQLHNIIDIEEIKKIRKELPKIKIIKAIPVADISALKEAKRYEKYVDYILLDTKGEKGRGGTGKIHNWNTSKKIVKSINKKVFLAGGLNPDNVEEAIKKVRPFAVDTNSGVKLKDRKKDKEKMRLFIERAKG